MIAGDPHGFVRVAEHDQLVDVFEDIIELCGPSTLVIGMANIGELGLGLVRLFKNRRHLEGEPC